MPDIINILHLSDLHFGAEASQKISQTLLDYRKNTLDSLIAFLERLSFENKPQVVVVSGDIGWSGKENDYNAAKDWLQKLLKATKLGPDKLCLVPGNHDLDRSKIEQQEIPQLAKEADIALTLEESAKKEDWFGHYTKFCEKDMKIPPYGTINDRQSYLWGIREIEGLKFLALNSAWYHFNEDVLGRLWLGLPQLKVMHAQKLISENNDDNSFITIALFHHPDGWFQEAERSAYSGRPSTFEYLGSRCHLMLSGHIHGIPTNRWGRSGGGAWQIITGATYKDASYSNNCLFIRIDKQARQFASCIIEYRPESAEDANLWSKRALRKNDWHTLRHDTPNTSSSSEGGSNTRKSLTYRKSPSPGIFFDPAVVKVFPNLQATELLEAHPIWGDADSGLWWIKSDSSKNGYLFLVDSLVPLHVYKANRGPLLGEPCEIERSQEVLWFGFPFDKPPEPVLELIKETPLVKPDNVLKAMCNFVDDLVKSLPPSVSDQASERPIDNFYVEVIAERVIQLDRYWKEDNKFVLSSGSSGGEETLDGVLVESRGHLLIRTRNGYTLVATPVDRNVSDFQRLFHTLATNEGNIQVHVRSLYSLTLESGSLLGERLERLPETLRPMAKSAVHKAEKRSGEKTKLPFVPVHGRVRLDNILWDRNEKLYLFGHAWSGDGPIFTDLASLEASVWLDWPNALSSTHDPEDLSVLAREYVQVEAAACLRALDDISGYPVSTTRGKTVGIIRSGVDRIAIKLKDLTPSEALEKYRRILHLELLSRFAVEPTGPTEDAFYHHRLCMMIALSEVCLEFPAGNGRFFSEANEILRKVFKTIASEKTGTCIETLSDIGHCIEVVGNVLNRQVIKLVDEVREDQKRENTEFDKSRLYAAWGCYKDILEFFNASTEGDESSKSGKVEVRKLLNNTKYQLLKATLSWLKVSEVNWWSGSQLYRGQDAIERSAKRVDPRVKDEEGTRKLQEFLANDTDLVVLGTPGSGKTWGLIKFGDGVFEDLGKRDYNFNACLGCWIPVYARVSAVMDEASSETKDKRNWPRCIVQALQSQPGTATLGKDEDLTDMLLKAGAFVFIYDGLNEVTADVCSTVAKELRAFKKDKSFQKNRLVLACRKRQWFNGGISGKFDWIQPVVEVQDLDYQEAATFVGDYFERNERHWFSELTMLLGLNSQETSALQGMARPSLARNPFFLDKIARVYIHNLRKSSGVSMKAALPVNRGDLLREYVKLETEHKRWLKLQTWILQVFGLQMTYKGDTNPPDALMSNLLQLAFCIAPVNALAHDDEGSPPLEMSELNFDVNLPSKTSWPPEKVAEFLATSGDDVFNNIQLIAHFKCSLSKMQGIFEEVSELIRKNAFLESWREETKENWAFAHQSMQEYFAAERFAQLYLDTKPDQLEELRHIKFDDMMNIAVGCIFRENQEKIGDIITYILEKGSRFQDVSSHLEHTEHMDEKVREGIAALAQKAVANPCVPDFIRASAVNCMGHREIDAKNEVGSNLLSKNGLSEGPKTWTAILDLCHRQLPRDNFASEVCKALESRLLLYFSDKSESGRINWQERQEIFLSATARWLRHPEQNKDIDGFARYLGSELIRYAEEGKSNTDVIELVWDIVTSVAPLPLNATELCCLVSSIRQPQLFAKILESKHTQRTGYLLELLKDKGALNQLERFRDIKDWSISVAPILKALGELNQNPVPLIKSIMGICTAKNDYTENLMETIWGLQHCYLNQADFSKWYLSWLLTLTPTKRPLHFDSRLENAVKKDNAFLIPVVDLIARIAITPRISQANRLLNVLELMSADGSFSENRSINLEPTDVVYRLKTWEGLSEEEKAYVLIAGRRVKESLDKVALLRFWEKDLFQRFFLLLYMGGGTDKFVQERPDHIVEISLGLRSGRYPQLKDDQELYIKELDGSDTSYSTRIALHQYLSVVDSEDSGRIYAHLTSHPGHPAPTPGGDNFLSLCRLLRYPKSKELAWYLLQRNESMWSEAEKAIISQHKELHPIFEEIVEKTRREKGTWTFSVGPQGKIIGHLSDPEKLEIASRHPDWLDLDQVVELIELFRENKQANPWNIIQILTQVSGWSKDSGDERFRNPLNTQVEFVLKARILPDEQAEDLVKLTKTPPLELDSILKAGDTCALKHFGSVQCFPRVWHEAIPYLADLRSVCSKIEKLSLDDVTKLVEELVNSAHKLFSAPKAAQVQTAAVGALEKLGETLSDSEELRTEVITWLNKILIGMRTDPERLLDSLMLQEQYVLNRQVWFRDILLREKLLVPMEKLEQIRKEVAAIGSGFQGWLKKRLTNRNQSFSKELDGIFQKHDVLYLRESWLRPERYESRPQEIFDSLHENGLFLCRSAFVEILRMNQEVRQKAVWLGAEPLPSGLNEKKSIPHDNVLFLGNYQELLSYLLACLIQGTEDLIPSSLQSVESLVEAVKSAPTERFSKANPSLFIDLQDLQVNYLHRNLKNSLKDEEEAVINKLYSQSDLNEKSARNLIEKLLSNWQVDYHCRSLQDCRSALFWELSRSCDWLDTINLSLLLKLFSKLPSTLRSASVEDLTNEVLRWREKDCAVPEWWQDFCLKVIAKYNSSAILSPEGFAVFLRVGSAWALRKSGTERTNVFVDAVVNITRNIQDRNYIDELTKWISEVQGRPAGFSRELQLSIERIVEEVDKLGWKVFVELSGW